MRLTTRLTQLREKCDQGIKRGYRALRAFQRTYATPERMRRYGRDLKTYFTNRPRMRVMIFVVFSLAFVWACTSACLMTSFMSGDVLALNCFQNDPPTRAEIENRMWLKLPASAQKVEAYTEGFSDCRYYARFEIAPADLDHFVNSSLVKLLSKQGTIPTALNFPPAIGRYTLDWNVSAIKSYLVGEGDKNQYHQRMLIDTTDATHFMVYVVLFET